MVGYTAEIKNTVLIHTKILIKILTMKIEYNNLYTHFVFTTRLREPVISENIRERIEKYITGIVNNNSSKMYAIYANPNHVHFLISRSPDMSEKTIASIVESSSEKFINDNKLIANRNFSWQRYASAFSVSKSHVDRVSLYILNQPLHHKKISWSEEYDKLLKYYQKTLRIEK